MQPQMRPVLISTTLWFRRGSGVSVGGFLWVGMGKGGRGAGGGVTLGGRSVRPAMLCRGR